MMEEKEMQNDSFRTLLMLQDFEDMPSMLEQQIMQKIEPALVRKPMKSFIQLKSIYFFGCMACVYVLFSLLSNYFIGYIDLIQEIKLMILLAMIVQTIYELNEGMPYLLDYIRIMINKKHAV